MLDVSAQEILSIFNKKVYQTINSQDEHSDEKKNKM